jgi:hypothetical protein
MCPIQRVSSCHYHTYTIKTIIIWKRPPGSQSSNRWIALDDLERVEKDQEVGILRKELFLQFMQICSQRIGYFEPEAF